MGELEDVLGLRPREAERREVPWPQLLIRSLVGNSQTTSCLTPYARTRLPRIAAAARREICCVVMATTSASNGRGFSVGRKPPSISTIGPRAPSAPAEARNASRSKGHRAADRFLFCRIAPGLDLDAAGCCTDAHLLACDDPVQPALVQHRRAVRPEVAEAARRRLEVVRC